MSSDPRVDGVRVDLTARPVTHKQALRMVFPEWVVRQLLSDSYEEAIRRGR